MVKINKFIFKKRVSLIFILILSVITLIIYLTNNSSSNKNKAGNNSTILTQSEDSLIKKEFSSPTNNIDSKLTRFANVKLINDNTGVPVLYYHSVRNPANNEVTISPEKLIEELKYIKDQGYITITISELKNYLLNNSPIPEKSIVITFDDGYMDNYYNAFPILKDFNMVATIFCITSNLDGSYYLSKDAIKEMSDYGIDIQSHTINHPKLNQLTYEDQLKELKESKRILESITCKEVDSIAYPFGEFNDDSIKAAKDAGYSLGFTTNRGLSDRADNPFKLDRIYISSKYDLNTFKEVLTDTVNKATS